MRYVNETNAKGVAISLRLTEALRYVGAPAKLGARRILLGHPSSRPTSSASESELTLARYLDKAKSTHFISTCTASMCFICMVSS